MAGEVALSTVSCAARAAAESGCRTGRRAAARSGPLIVERSLRSETRATVPDSRVLGGARKEIEPRLVGEVRWATAGWGSSGKSGGRHGPPRDEGLEERRWPGRSEAAPRVLGRQRSRLLSAGGKLIHRAAAGASSNRRAAAPIRPRRSRSRSKGRRRSKRRRGRRRRGGGDCPPPSGDRSRESEASPRFACAPHPLQKAARVSERPACERSHRHEPGWWRETSPRAPHGRPQASVGRKRRDGAIEMRGDRGIIRGGHRKEAAPRPRRRRPHRRRAPCSVRPATGVEGIAPTASAAGCRAS